MPPQNPNNQVVPSVPHKPSVSVVPASDLSTQAPISTAPSAEEDALFAQLTSVPPSVPEPMVPLPVPPAPTKETSPTPTPPLPTPSPLSEIFAKPAAESAPETFPAPPVAPMVEEEKGSTPSPEAPVVVIKKEIPIEEEIATLEQDLIALDKKKETIENETVILLEQRQKIEDALAPLLQAEREYRAVIALVEKREQGAKGSDERRAAEKERWEVEDKRGGVEEKKWVHKEELEKVLTAISAKEIGHKTIVDEELAIAERIHSLEIESKRRELTHVLEGIKAERGEAEAKRAVLLREIENTRVLLHETSEKEKTAETKERETDDAMRMARSFGEERALAAERHLLEVQRREAEEARWKAEDDLKQKGATAEEVEKSVASIAAEEEDIVAKIQSLK